MTIPFFPSKVCGGVIAVLSILKNEIIGVGLP